MDGWQAWVGPAFGALALIITGFLTFRSSRKNSNDTTELARETAKAKLNADIDARVEEQLRGAWDKIEEQKKSIKGLEASQTLTDRRELLMYRYIRETRNHIINQLPPPPPAIPDELIEFFEDLESTV